MMRSREHSRRNSGVGSKKRFLPPALSGARRRGRLFGWVCYFALPVFLSSLPATADGQERSPARRGTTQLLLGCVLNAEPIYEGSDEMRLLPIPMISASFETRSVKAFIEGFEAGLELKSKRRFLPAFALGIGLGDDRETDATDLLHGTPTLANPVRLFGEARARFVWDTEVTARAAYVPIAARYEGDDRDDRKYAGMLFDLDLEREFLFLPFTAEIKGGVSWMNDRYAAANYGVDYATPRLGQFEAHGGFKDIHAAAVLTLFFSLKTGIAAFTEGLYLVGDARDSPLTARSMQPSFGILAWRRF